MLKEGRSALVAFTLLAKHVCAPLPFHLGHQPSELLRIEGQGIVLREDELARGVVFVVFIRCLLLGLAGALCSLRRQLRLDLCQHHLELLGIDVEVDQHLLIDHLGRAAQRLLQLLEDDLELDALSIIRLYQDHSALCDERPELAQPDILDRSICLQVCRL